MKFVGSEEMDMEEKVAFNKVVGFANKELDKCLGRYLDSVKYKYRYVNISLHVARS
jgi:hypothetical protein